MGQYYLYTMKNAVLLPVTVKNITRNSLFKKGSDLFLNRVLLHSCSKQECEVAVPGTFLKICLACLDLKSLFFVGICTGILSGNSCQENLILVVQRSRYCVPLVYQDILPANNLFFLLFNQKCPLHFNNNLESAIEFKQDKSSLSLLRYFSIFLFSSQFIQERKLSSLYSVASSEKKNIHLVVILCLLQHS